MSSKDPRNTFLPGWVSDLRPLADSAEWLAKLASNPVGTLRGTVRTILSVIVVGGAIDMGEALIASLLAVGEAFVAIPEITYGLIGSAGGAVGNGILQAATWYVGVIEGASASLGPFGIFLQVGAYGVTAVILLQAIPPMLNALSDALGAVPVIGSLLDAVLTFAIGWAESLAGVFGGDN